MAGNAHQTIFLPFCEGVVSPPSSSGMDPLSYDMLDPFFLSPLPFAYAVYILFFLP